MGRLTQQAEALLDQFERIEDEYLRERKADVMQVVERVLKALIGQPRHLPAPRHTEEDSILVAHDLSPADVILFKQHRFGSFVTDLGGATSHTAILARSLNIPSIVALHHARAADPRERTADRGRQQRRGDRQPRTSTSSRNTGSGRSNGSSSGRSSSASRPRAPRLWMARA